MKKELNFHRGKGARLRPKHLAEAITKLGFTDEHIEKLESQLDAADIENEELRQKIKTLKVYIKEKFCGDED